jgi:HK97 family phage prohead protease
MTVTVKPQVAHAGAWSWKATHSGGVEGYLTVWNLVDAENDVTEKGAFDGVIKAWRASDERLPLVLDHDPAAEVGEIVDLEEDQVGVRFRATFDETRRGQDARHRALTGDVRGISYSYRADRRAGWVRGKAVQIIERIRALTEVTLSLRSTPVNPLAQLVTAKAGVGWPSMPLPAASRVVTVAMEIELRRRELGIDDGAELRRKAAELGRWGWPGDEMIAALGVEAAYDLGARVVADRWHRRHEIAAAEQREAEARLKGRREERWQRGWAEIRERAVRPCGRCWHCRRSLPCEYGRRSR